MAFDPERVLSLDVVDKQCEESGHRDALEQVQAYCMFLGYPRSGHSLVGSLLDAHPNMVVAQELDALEFIKAGCTRRQLFYLLLENSEKFCRSGRTWNGYSYAVPNQWQGRYRELRVIGDKKGGRSSLLLRNDPDLLDRLRGTIQKPLKLIHVVRNPFDNVSTISRAHRLDLDAAAQTYFERAETVQRIREQVPAADFYNLRHEMLIERPTHALRELCAFLGEPATDDYLADCASVVYARPHRSRLDVDWTADQKHRTADRCRSFPFLDGYAFES